MALPIPMNALGLLVLLSAIPASSESRAPKIYSIKTWTFIQLNTGAD